MLGVKRLVVSIKEVDEVSSHLFGILMVKNGIYNIVMYIPYPTHAKHASNFLDPRLALGNIVNGT